MPVPVPTALLLSHLPTQVLESTEDDGQSAWASVTHIIDQDGFGLAQPWLLGHLGSEHILCLCLLNKYIDKYFTKWLRFSLGIWGFTDTRTVGGYRLVPVLPGSG